MTEHLSSDAPILSHTSQEADYHIPTLRTPDEVLTARTLSDAELLREGARYKDGVLKLTPEQIETLSDGREEAKSALATLASGLTIHRPEYASLEYLNGENAIENETKLQSRIEDIISPYEDVLRPEFPSKVKLFDKTAYAQQSTTRIVGNKEVVYDLTYVAAKGEDRKVVPESVIVNLDMYGVGKPTWSDDAPRDAIELGYKDAKIARIKLVTQPLSRHAYWASDVRGIQNVSKMVVGPAREGVAQAIIDRIDASAMPENLIYNENMIDRAYSAEFTLEPGHYEVRLTREQGSYPNNPRTLDEDSLQYDGTESMAYRFVPERNRFIRIETEDEWQAGPAELSVDQFGDLIGAALGNLPTMRVTS